MHVGGTFILFILTHHPISINFLLHVCFLFLSWWSAAFHSIVLFKHIAQANLSLVVSGRFVPGEGGCFCFWWEEETEEFLSRTKGHLPAVEGEDREFSHGVSESVDGEC